MTQPIGVFDSGLGGLTVVRELRERLPGAPIYYLGDTARIPYGVRSPETVIRYAERCAAHLLEQDILLLVIACNTVSAVALEPLRASSAIPVFGVVEPGARAALAASKNERIGVLATRGTVASQAYIRAIRAGKKNVHITQNAAPLFVPLVEEGWGEGDVVNGAIDHYLAPLLKANVDTIVLGCTHYPILRTAIKRRLSSLGHSSVLVVDGGEMVAKEVAAHLDDNELEVGQSAPLAINVTDQPKHFAELVERFLPGVDATIRLVDL